MLSAVWGSRIVSRLSFIGMLSLPALLLEIHVERVDHFLDNASILAKAHFHKLMNGDERGMFPVASV
jgi:hypothetical protein